MATIDDQVIISELEIERTELYNELIEMVEDNNYDLDEINDINHEIQELDVRLLKIDARYVPAIRKLNKE